jgi:hypothetical protein
VELHQTIGQWKLVRALPDGAWLAEDTLAPGTVGRILPPDAADPSWHERSWRLLRKLRSTRSFVDALSLTPHPDHPDQRMLVMDAPTGRSVAAALADSKGLQTPEAVRVIRAITDAVVAMHAEGFVHGALTLDRIHLDPHGRPRLWDVGLALPADGAVRPTDDVMGLGRCLHGMLTGRPLTARPEAHTVPAALDPGEAFSASIRALIRDMTAPDPAQRPADVAELRERLESLGGKQPPRRTSPRSLILSPPTEGTPPVRNSAADGPARREPPRKPRPPTPVPTAQLADPPTEESMGTGPELEMPMPVAREAGATRQPVVVERVHSLGETPSGSWSASPERTGNRPDPDASGASAAAPPAAWGTEPPRGSDAASERIAPPGGRAERVPETTAPRIAPPAPLAPTTPPPPVPDLGYAAALSSRPAAPSPVDAASLSARPAAPPPVTVDVARSAPHPTPAPVADARAANLGADLRPTDAASPTMGFVAGRSTDGARRDGAGGAVVAEHPGRGSAAPVAAVAPALSTEVARALTSAGDALVPPAISDASKPEPESGNPSQISKLVATIRGSGLLSAPWLRGATEAPAEAPTPAPHPAPPPAPTPAPRAAAPAEPVVDPSPPRIAHHAAPTAAAAFHEPPTSPSQANRRATPERLRGDAGPGSSPGVTPARPPVAATATSAAPPRAHAFAEPATSPGAHRPAPRSPGEGGQRPRVAPPGVAQMPSDDRWAGIPRADGAIADRNEEIIPRPPPQTFHDGPDPRISLLLVLFTMFGVVGAAWIARYPGEYGFDTPAPAAAAALVQTTEPGLTEPPPELPPEPPRAPPKKPTRAAPKPAPKAATPAPAEPPPPAPPPAAPPPPPAPVAIKVYTGPADAREAANR